MGGAIGAAVAGEVVISDPKKFESDRAAEISCIASSLDHRVESGYRNQLEKELKNQPFFAKRLNKSSPYGLQTEVVSYGLIRSGNDEPMRFAANMGCRVNLKGEGNEKLLENVLVSGKSTSTATLEQFASNWDLLNKAFREATINTASNMSQELQKRTEKLTPCGFKAIRQDSPSPARSALLRRSGR